VSSERDQRLEAAEALLRAGRIGQATAAIRELIAVAPDFGEAHALLGEALAGAGDGAGAEASLRNALALNSRQPAAATQLANILIARRALAEAATLLEPLVQTPLANADLLNAYGVALRGLGRMDEGVEAHRAAADAAPAVGAYAHNLAGALGDAHRFAESEKACERAFATGLDAPETWLVRGRALIGLGRLDEAEASIGEAIRRRPAFADAHAELAQLIWIRTEDLDQAKAGLDAALVEAPLDPPLSLARAKLLEYAQDAGAAYASLGPVLEARPGDLQLQVAAALLALREDGAMAMFHALKAEAIDPASGQAAAALCQANLAIGRPYVAASIAERLCAEWPLDQHPVTLAATAWRLLGDPRYFELYDYERLVRAYPIEAPKGWATPAAYVADLANALSPSLGLKGHPIGQSLRHGVQSNQSLERSENPVIRALFSAVDGPIRSYIDGLRGRDDVLGRRAQDDYRFSGAWSVRLRPGGSHVNHIHPMGWISSAFHVVVPPAVDESRQGWLKFGEPDLPTTPKLEADHFVKPVPGTLVLFPSYMWHGTVPFGGEASRLTAAFDALPA
jgi:tetratricopeptide (TPR) repeat protein